ncbi:universal stress protein [Streptomyces sp. NPDC058583]|uniref:universal stress protein n=1 Tax=unclassified Streptomyces TaxID=2593676 RepID=UPI0036559A60
MNDVLVGVDPSDLSIPALLWAADEAVRRALPLRLVAAVPPVHDRLWYDVLAHQGSVRIRTESALANAVDLVRELHDGLRTVTELVDGVPATVLRDRTARSVLAVVGSRRLGRAAEILSEGSVVVPLTAHADCPVVVVRAPEHPSVHPPALVVGVDGSEACREAVAFAFEEASLREACLRAVWVWPRPLLSHDDVEEGLAVRRRLLSESMAGWAERYPDVVITEEVLRGHPVQQLALTSQDSIALVLGRRGRGGYRGMRLGSTVHGLLHHADCPVITVPLPEREGREVDRPWAERSRFPTDRPALGAVPRSALGAPGPGRDGGARGRPAGRPPGSTER